MKRELEILNHVVGSNGKHRLPSAGGRTAERESVEEALRASQQILEGILNAIPVRVFWKDRNLVFLGCNAAFAHDAGFANPKDVIGKDDYQMGWRDQAELYRGDDRQVMESGRSRFLVEEPQTTPEGKTITLLTSKIPLRTSDGEVGGVLGTYMDITDRKTVEERIRAQAELLDLAQDAIAVRDLDGCVQYWNKSCERLTGWSRAEVLGKPMDELLRLNPTVVDLATKMLLQRGHWTGEIVMMTKDERPVPLISRCTLLRDVRGQPMSVLTINTDMTEQKRLEAQFLRAQRLESIGQLAGGIAHDLNNILAPILMCAPMLREVISSQQGLSMLNTLESSARRGADIVKQLLTFARGTEGKRVLLQLYQVTREIAKMVQETFPKSITLETAVPGNLWPISADPTQLHQVLLNLAVNARDAMMPQGGTLKLAADNVLLRELEVSVMPGLQPGPYVLLRVSDTGTGIPPEVAARMFDPFFTTKGEGKGTGLGLSTVMSIVKSHGGFVDFTSGAGQGTEFRVYLPAEMRQEAPAGGVAQTPPPRGHGELILIADDEEAIRSITRRTLESFGYRTLLANNGAEAVALYQEKLPEIAVVLLDLNMPLLGGADTITALFKLNPKVRVVVATGTDSESRLPAEDEPGVRGFLRKPFETALLLNTINKLITMD